MSVKLGSVCSKIGSGATPTGGQESYKESGISLIRSQNILDFQFSMDGLAYIDDEQASKLDGVTVKKNDILINITGDSVARTCKVPPKVLPARVNQHVSIVRANQKDLDYDYLLYTLINLKQYLLSISEIGATRRAITKKMLEDIELELPPISEQQSIASVLSSIDDKIDLLNRQNKTLEALAETYFRQWFFEEAGEETAFISNYARLEKISVNPKTMPNEQFYHYSIPAYDEGKRPILEFGKEILSNKFKVPSKVILVSKLNPITPRVWAVLENKGENCVCSTEFQVIKPISDKYFYYLYFLLKSEAIVAEFAMSASGTSGSHQRIRPEYILNVEMAKPNENRIKEFNEAFDDYINKINNNLKQIQTLQKLRDTLLPKLVSGEVKVKM